jgi:hypothetical protein
MGGRRSFADNASDDGIVPESVIGAAPIRLRLSTVGGPLAIALTRLRSTARLQTFAADDRRPHMLRRRIRFCRRFSDPP